jgi:regulator of telomere elongation helicase 1
MQIGYNLPPSKPTPINMMGAVGGFGNSTKLIIYASRTHNQLTQVISELRSTGYKPRMTVMASREQLCVHDRISKLRGGALNHACSKASSARSCMYKNNLENYSGGVEGAGGTGGAPVMDIEQLVQLGREDRVCPYFFSRDVATKSELILLPYNYLIDGSIRSTLRGIEWQDCCVILDEAHNLEQVASDAAAFSLSSADIAACILELKQVIRLMQTLGSSGATENASKSGASIGQKMLGALNSLPSAGEKPDIMTCECH